MKMTGNRIIVKELKCDRRFPTTLNEELLQSLCGTFWTLAGEDMYIFAQVGNCTWTMVSLINGNRYFKPFKYDDIVQINKTWRNSMDLLEYFVRCYGEVTIISKNEGSDPSRTSFEAKVF
jgi:hypothetical protein